MFSNSSGSSSTIPTRHVTLQGEPVEMIIDTGASVNLNVRGGIISCLVRLVDKMNCNSDHISTEGGHQRCNVTK